MSGTPSEIPSWAIAVPRGGGVHKVPADLSQWNALSEEVRKQLSGQLLESIVSQIVVAVRGLFIPGNFGTALAQLAEWVQTIPIIGDLVEFLTGIEDGNLNDLGTWANGLKRNFTLLFDYNGDGAGLTWEDLTSFLWDATLPLRRIPPINLGRLTPDDDNLVYDNGFLTLPEGGTGGWYRRPDVGHTTLSSAWIDAADTPGELIGSTLLVKEGQKYLAEVWWESESATASADALTLTVYEYDAAHLQIGAVPVATATPAGTTTWAKINNTTSTPYVVPAGVTQIALGAKVDGLTAGRVGIDDLKMSVYGKLQMDWTEGLKNRWIQIAKGFGLEDTDLDGDIDFEDVWNQLWTEVPAAINLAIDTLGTTFQGFLDLLASAFDPVLRLLGITPPTGNSANATAQKAVALADIAQHAYSTTILAANDAGDSQANEDDGIEIVDLNVFSGTDGDFLNPLDWVSSQTSGVDDVVVRTEGGLPVMGIRAPGGTPNLTSLPAGKYYHATWVDTFSTTTGYGQLVEMVLGYKGTGLRDTIILFHSNSTFTDGAYLKANHNGLSFGHYTSSAGVYTFDSPIGTWPEGLSTGQRVGCFNSPQDPTVFNLTIAGKTVLQVDDTGGTIALDSSHISARILLERKLYTYTPPGWPWPSTGWTDSFRPAQVLFADYDPPAIRYTGVQVSRHNTAGATRSSGWSAWTGVIDTVDNISRDLDWGDATPDVLTVSKEGWYTCATRSGSLDGSLCGVFKNGSLAGVGGQGMQVYCLPGDELAPATNSSASIVGSSDGFTAYFHVVQASG